MKIYIDIDGVLLTKSMQVPAYSEQFIDYLISNHECYWLTTHCRTGANKSLQYLSNFYKADIIEKMKSIRPTNWVNKKTEGIDFSSDFIWLDDYPFESEKEDLINHNCLDSLLVVDLINPEELKNIDLKIRRKANNISTSNQ